MVQKGFEVNMCINGRMVYFIYVAPTSFASFSSDDDLNWMCCIIALVVLSIYRTCIVPVPSVGLNRFVCVLLTDCINIVVDSKELLHGHFVNQSV